MPRRKYNKKRKNYKKRYMNPSPLNTNPVPNTTVCKLRYCDNAALNPGAASIAYNTYSANGCYDPDISGGGHQPLGYDQWSTFYDNYQVLGSKVTATFYPNGTDAMVVGIYLDDDTTSLGTMQTILEQANVSYTSFIGAAYKPYSVTKTFSSKRFFGKKRVDDANLRAGIGANPTQQAYFQVMCSDPTTGDPGSITVLVQIDYIVLFSERKTLAQS